MTRPTPLTSAQKADRLRLQASDGATARAEYAAEVEREEEKTVRLRALRLDRDRRLAAEAAAAPPKKSPKKAPAKAARAKTVKA
jgi:hypothetical protein